MAAQAGGNPAETPPIFPLLPWEKGERRVSWQGRTPPLPAGTALARGEDILPPMIVPLYLPVAGEAGKGGGCAASADGARLTGYRPVRSHPTSRLQPGMRLPTIVSSKKTDGRKANG